MRRSLYDVVPQVYEVDIDHPLLTPAQRGVHNLEVEVGGRGRADEIVAFVNEERPFFQTSRVGSMIYAEHRPNADGQFKCDIYIRKTGPLSRQV